MRSLALEAHTRAACTPASDAHGAIGKPTVRRPARSSQVVFIESITRIHSLSLSARLVRPFLHVLYVHWPQLQSRYPRAELISDLVLEPAERAVSGLDGVIR